MSSKAITRVTVLNGGPSVEREVSLVSGNEIASALRGEGYIVSIIDADENLAPKITASNPDVVFNALHGRWGEDGCVQGLLEWMQIPYTHSGVLSSALAMDKEKTKEVFRAEGLPVVESLLIARADLGKTHPMALPYVIKPNNEGSSVGVYLVEEGALSPPPLSDDMPDVVMVEAFAPGRELTTTVLGARALTVTDILTDRWYDYDAKYVEGGSQHIVPANLPQDIFSACLDYALKAHEVLGCRGISRTDFRWDEGRGLDGLVLLETNTQPGMTPLSLVPEQAKQMGISYEELVELIVREAL